jgi:hypothetical protein
VIRGRKMADDDPYRSGLAGPTDADV